MLVLLAAKRSKRKTPGWLKQVLTCAAICLPHKLCPAICRIGFAADVTLGFMFCHDLAGGLFGSTGLSGQICGLGTFGRHTRKKGQPSGCQSIMPLPGQIPQKPQVSVDDTKSIGGLDLLAVAGNYSGNVVNRWRNRHASVFGLHGVQACRRGNDRAGAM